MRSIMISKSRGCSVSAENTIALRQLAKAFRASPASPVGFVFDDVGRLGAEAWSQFARETPASSGTILLGSVREFILRERARAKEIRVAPDAEVAERMWRSLHAANQTKWEGWAEPWATSSSRKSETSVYRGVERRNNEDIMDHIICGPAMRRPLTRAGPRPPR